MSSSRNFGFPKANTEDESKSSRDHFQRETALNQNSARKLRQSNQAFRPSKDNDEEMMDRLFRKGGMAEGEVDVSPAKSGKSSGHRVARLKSEEEQLENIEYKIQELLDQVEKAKEDRLNSPRKLVSQKEYQELSSLTNQFKEVQRQVQRFPQEAEVMDSNTETKLVQFKHIIAMGLSDIKKLNSELRSSIVSPTKVDLQKNISNGMEKLKIEQGTLQFAQGLREVQQRISIHREAFEQTEVLVAGMKEAPELEKESELAIQNLLEDIQRNLSDLNQLIGELEQLKELRSDDFERLKIIQQKENKLKSTMELTSEFQQLQLQVSMEMQKKCKLNRQQLKNKSETLQWTLDELEKNQDKVFQVHVSKKSNTVSDTEPFRIQAEIIKKLTIQTVKSHQIIAKQLEVEITKKEDSLLQLFQVFRTLKSLEWKLSVLQVTAQEIQLKAQLCEKGLKDKVLEAKEKFLEEQRKLRDDLEDSLAQLDDKQKQLDLGIQNLTEEMEHIEDPELLGELQKELQDMKAALKASEREKRKIKGSLDQLGNELDNSNPQKLQEAEMDAIATELKHNKDQIKDLADQNGDIGDKMEKLRTKLQQAAQKEQSKGQQLCFQIIAHVREEFEEVLELICKSENQLIMLQRSKQEAEQQMNEEPYQLSKDLEKLRSIKSIQTKISSESSELDLFKKDFVQLQADTKECEDQLQNAGAPGALKEFEHQLQSRIQKQASALKSSVEAQLERRCPPIWEEIQQFMTRSEAKTQVFNVCVRLQAERAAQCEDLEEKTGQFKETILQLASKLAARDDVKGGKRVRLDALQEDLSGLEDEIRKKLKEIRRQEQLLEQICQDLTLTTVKIVTTQDLEQARVELENMDTLDALEGDLEGLYDRIKDKSKEIDQFFQDLLDGQVGDCEERLKDAKDRLRKLIRRDTDWGNSQNDFDQDMMQDLAVSDDSTSLKDLNCKIQGEEAKDRRKLKDIDIKARSLQDLLSAIEDQIHLKDQLAPQKLQEILDQIEDCIGTTDNLNNDVGHLEANLEEQKQEWEEAVAKDNELKDMVDKALKQLQGQKALLGDVQARGNEIGDLLEGFQMVIEAMDKNPDYETRKPMIEKLKDQVASAKAEVAEIEMDSQSAMQKIKDLVKQAENCDSLEQVAALAKKVRDHQEKVEKLDQKSDRLLDSLQKRRAKLADADVNENAKKRKAELGELEELCNDINKKLQELEPYIFQVQKQNPEQGEVYKSQLRAMQDKFEQTKDKTYDLGPKIERLLNKLQDKDLAQGELQQIPPFIKEVLALKSSVEAPRDLLLELKKDADILLNKLGNVDFDQKFQELGANYEDQSERLKKLRQELEQLKDLDGAFIGYTSDEEEEQFIDKLDGDLEDLFNDCDDSEQKNNEIRQSLEEFQKILEEKPRGSALSPQEIEERAQCAAQIQNDQEQLVDFIEDMEDRDQAAIEVFMGMDVDAKLERRRREVEELDKRIVQFQDNQDELEKELKVAHQRLSSQNGQEDKLDNVTQAVDEMKKMQKEYPKIRSDLQSVAEDIEDLSNSDESQFQMLLGNIQLKKRILDCLNRIRDLRAKYQDLRKIYELNKPLAQKRYKAAKGDDVDQMLSNWLSGNDCPVPIQRLGKGYYMFGTKKIFAKIINGQLLIRVGGGFMSIDEFMFYYGAQELNKMLAYQGQEQENLEVDLGNVVDDSVNKSDLMKVDDNGRPMIGVQQMKKRMSPRPATAQAANAKATPKTTSGKKQPQPSAGGSFVKQGASRIGSGIPKK